MGDPERMNSNGSEWSRTAQEPVQLLRRGPRVPQAPRVSVVIPAYDARWLDDALASVRGQTWPDFEIIVVDDGAPVPVAPSRTDDLVLVRQANAGPGGARNRGVQLARGSLVAFLDADDRWRPEKLARQVAFHDRRPACVMSCTDLSLMGGGVRSIAGAGNVLPFERLVLENPVATSTVMLDRTAWQRTPGMPLRIRFGEDYLQWLRLAMLGEVGHLAEPLTERRLHSDSLAHTSQASSEWITTERALYEAFLAEHPALRGSTAIRRGQARLEYQAGYFHLTRRNWPAARDALVRSLMADPRRLHAWISLVRSFVRLGPRAGAKAGRRVAKATAA